jgi:site-specific recombinase XerD
VRHFRGIWLSPRQTKGKKARLFPFGLAPDLKAILEAAFKARNGDYVFQGPRAGKPLGYTTLLHHWQGATKRAGCEGRIIHDLRRTAVQSFVEAGVDEGTIMELCGMTRSIFQRYLIVRQERLNAAVAARFNGTLTAHPTPTRQVA